MLAQRKGNRMYADRVVPGVSGYVIIAWCLILLPAATGEVRIDYDPGMMLKPNDPSLKLNFSSLDKGEVTFVDGALVTVDSDTIDTRGGWGLYYRRQFSQQEFNENTDLRIEVTVKVINSTVSPASTCVQFTTRNGRTFGLGFRRNKDGGKRDDTVVLYADNGKPPPAYGKHGLQDWLLEPVVLGNITIPVNVKRTYVLELLRQGKGEADDIVRLSIAGSTQNPKPLTVRLTDLPQRVAVPGLVFGHPVNQGTGQAQWHRLTITTTGTPPFSDLRRIGDKRQLFLDDWIIAKTENIERRLENPEKYSGNPVMFRDKPWDEARCDNYGNVVWDPQQQQLQFFYSGQSVLPEGRDDRLLYAESRTGGLTWEKPALNFFPFGAHQQTNIILQSRCRFMSGPCVFRDEHDANPSRRYKLFTADYGERLDGQPSEPGIYVAFSPDGIVWDPSQYSRVLPLHSDTQQCAFWDPRIGRFVAYVRMKPKGFGRSVGRTESDDFQHWTPPELTFVHSRQIYAIGVTPYEGLYIGMPWILWHKSRDHAERTRIISPALAVSRDGWTWQMLTNPGEAYIPVGSAGNGDKRPIRQIRASSSFLVLGDRILFSYGQSADPHVLEMRVELGLATLRLDGFVAMVAGSKAGQLLTKPFVLEGSELRINATCEENGSITVAVLDENGQPLPGFADEQCVAIRGDGIKLPVTWRGKESLGRWQSQPIRLRFTMRDSKLYSFQLAP